MKNILWRLLINMASLYATVQFIGEPRIHLRGFGSYLFAALVLGFVNTFIKPILKILTFPINFLTLGLFGIILNAFLLKLVAVFSPLSISGFFTTLEASIILGLVSAFLTYLFK